MIKSMTGFGKEVVEFADKKISVEIKSLNSKQFDLSIRLPFVYREKELELRSALLAQLLRGKVEVNVFIERQKTEASSRLNRPVLDQYLVQLKDVAQAHQLDTSSLMGVAMRMPEVMISETPQVDEKEWDEIQNLMQSALQQFDVFRCHEGEIMRKDFEMRIQLILSILKEIETFEGRRISTVRERMLANLEKYASQVAIDDSRFEQELFYYVEKLDITEEKVRLQKHCDYFLTTLDDEGAGKKLGFVTQEIGREVNTIGSKANDVDIQKCVVRMKDELEKVKEQLGNVL